MQRTSSCSVYVVPDAVILLDTRCCNRSKSPEINGQRKKSEIAEASLSSEPSKPQRNYTIPSIIVLSNSLQNCNCRSTLTLNTANEQFQPSSKKCLSQWHAQQQGAAQRGPSRELHLTSYTNRLSRANDQCDAKLHPTNKIICWTKPRGMPVRQKAKRIILRRFMHNQ